jgi:hypothetical protein
MQTVGPLAARLGLEVIKRYSAGDEAHLVKEISTRPGATLIAWHHEALHAISQHLGEVHPSPPDYWPNGRFDIVWTFTPDGHRWRFAQDPATPAARRPALPHRCSPDRGQDLT